MNQSQLKYARERLEKAFHEKQAKVGRRYGYTNEEKIKLWEEGKASIQLVNNSLSIVFENEDEYKKEQNAKYEAVAIEYRKVLDELMLGDNAAALELINKFVGE
jgi:hypothetical protein